MPTSQVLLVDVRVGECSPPRTIEAGHESKGRGFRSSVVRTQETASMLRRTGRKNKYTVSSRHIHVEGAKRGSSEGRAVRVFVVATPLREMSREHMLQYIQLGYFVERHLGRPCRRT